MIEADQRESVGGERQLAQSELIWLNVRSSQATTFAKEIEGGPHERRRT